MISTTIPSSVQNVKKNGHRFEFVGIGEHKVRDRIHRVKLCLMLCAHII